MKSDISPQRGIKGARCKWPAEHAIMGFITPHGLPAIVGMPDLVTELCKKLHIFEEKC